jgi:hypothetical protein
MAYKETRKWVEKWVESVSAHFRCREEYSNATTNTTNKITNHHQQSPTAQSPTITNNTFSHNQHHGFLVPPTPNVFPNMRVSMVPNPPGKLCINVSPPPPGNEECMLRRRVEECRLEEHR